VPIVVTLIGRIAVNAPVSSRPPTTIRPAKKPPRSPPLDSASALNWKRSGVWPGGRTACDRAGALDYFFASSQTFFKYRLCVWYS